MKLLLWAKGLTARVVIVWLGLLVLRCVTVLDARRLCCVMVLNLLIRVMKPVNVK
jgi:hypothetical protein